MAKERIKADRRVAKTLDKEHAEADRRIIAEVQRRVAVELARRLAEGRQVHYIISATTPSPFPLPDAASLAITRAI